MGELITWCRIFRTGPVCPTPCDDCRRTSRANALVAQVGGPAVTLAAAHAELGVEVSEDPEPGPAPNP